MKESCYEDDGSTADQITIEVNNFDDSSNESHFTNSWDSIATSASLNAASLTSNVSSAGKSRLVKFKKNSREFREIVKIKPSRQSPVKAEREFKKRRLVQESPAVTTMQRVVTDVPEKENKLKRPGPFQAANKVLSTLSSAPGPVRTGGPSSGWMTQMKAATSTGSGSLNSTNSKVSTASESTGTSSSGVPCNYCSVTLTTKLEADLHTVAQHRHERACLKEPLTCLEEGCTQSFTNLYGMKQHLETVHQIAMASKFFTFQHMEEFNSWKKELEAGCGSKFQFFSVFSEVTGGTTRLFVCNNEGRYDHHYAKLVRPRKRHGRKHQRCTGVSDQRKCGRACPAQLLVRSWGWGAIEVDALLLHYGHLGEERATAAQGDDALLTAEQAAERPLAARADGGGQPGGAGRREDGVRIIEGSMLGQRGLDDLQTDLARWELINNVSICVCKRRDETDLQGLVQFEDFVLGFTTSDQLEAWARHGGRAICLDNAQIRVSGGVSSLMEGQLSVCSVQVVTATSHVLPVAWLLTSRYSDSLLKYFLMCLRVAYESFHNGPVTEPRFVMGETDSRFYKIWHEVFGGSAPPVMAARNTHKSWMAHLNSVIDPNKRQQVWEEMFSVVRDSNGTDDSPAAMHELLQRLAQDPETEPFASYMTEQWLPQQRLEDSVLPAAAPALLRTSKSVKYRDKTSNRGLYLDVLHTLYTFLYVDQDFSIDCDECVYKVQQFTASALLEAESVHKSAKADKRGGVNGVHGCDASPSSAALRPGSGGRTSRLAQLTEARHKTACAMGPDSVTSTGPHSWRVRSPNLPGEVHIVKREAVKRSASQGSLRSICSSSCAQVCRLCEVCVHQYTCTCPDSVILSVVCVHVHLIRVLMRNPQHVPVLPSAGSAARSTFVNSRSPLHQSEEKLKTAIKQKCYSIISMLKTDNVIFANSKGDGLSNRWDTEYLLQCDQQLEAIVNSLNNSRTSLTNIDSINTSTSFSNSVVNSSFTRSVLPENDQNSPDSDPYYVRVKSELHTADSPGGSADGHHGCDKSSAESDAVATYRCTDNSNNLVVGGGNDELLVLQEENGRYRLVTGEHELLGGRAQAKNSILYGAMTPADPSTFLVHRTEDRTSSVAPVGVNSGLR